MTDLDLFDPLREALADVRMHAPVVTILDRGNSLRRRRTTALLASACGIMGIAGFAGIAGFGLAGTQGPTHPQAVGWTVERVESNEIDVTVYQLKDVRGLEATLRDDGVPVVVTASMALPQGCQNWDDGTYDMGDVVTTSTQSGLPNGTGTELVLRPTLIPTGALLWLGLAQSGAPSGSTGPSGPIASGFVANTTACWST